VHTSGLTSRGWASAAKTAHTAADKRTTESLCSLHLVVKIVSKIKKYIWQKYARTKYIYTSGFIEFSRSSVLLRVFSH